MPRLFLVAIGMLLPLLPSVAFGVDASWDVKLFSKSVYPGQIIVISLEKASFPSSNFKVTFSDLDIQLFNCPSKPDQNLCGIVPIPFETKAGSYEISARREDSGVTRALSFSVQSGLYKTVKIQVNDETVHVNSEDQERAKREWQETKEILHKYYPKLFWNTPFQLPVASKVTSPFGVKRVFNDVLQSYHQGVDLRAWTGTSIRAANSGIVRLASNRFYAGNSVIIDHGFGFFTSYAHLSRIDVKRDQSVEKGQVIGLAGATGRVSGPHLHWGATINGISVDAMQLKKSLQPIFPKISAKAKAR